MQAVTVTMGTGNRTPDLHSSQPPTSLVVCAESLDGLRAHGETRGVRGLSYMPMGSGQRRGGVGQKRGPNLWSLHSGCPYVCSTCAGLESFPPEPFGGLGRGQKRSSAPSDRRFLRPR